jgi:peroxiredoxin
MKMKWKNVHLRTAIAFATGVCLTAFATFYFQRGAKPAKVAAYKKQNEYRLWKSVPGGVPNFSLNDQDGRTHELYRYSDAKGIVLLSVADDCEDGTSLTRWLFLFTKKEYETLGIKFFLIDPVDTREKLNKLKYKLPFDLPILHDPSQIVSSTLHLSRTNEVLLIQPGTWQILYRGPIVPVVPADPNDRDIDQYNGLVHAIDDLLAGRKIAEPQQALVNGCPLHIVGPSVPPEYLPAAKLFSQKCLPCHVTQRPVFDGHNTVRGWADAIKDELISGRMPLWGLDSKQGEFFHDFSLAPKELRLLYNWVDQKMVRRKGDVDWIAGAYKSMLEKRAAWLNREGQPTYSASTSKPIEVPEEGFLDYRYYQLGEAVPKDMFVSEIRTTSKIPEAVHHMMLLVTKRPLSFFENVARKDSEWQINADPGTLPIYVLNAIQRYEGANPFFSRIGTWNLGSPGVAYYGGSDKFPTTVFVPKGSYLILEAHHHGNGRPSKDLITLDFYNDKRDPKVLHKGYNYWVGINHIEIPPEVREFKVKTDPKIVPEDIYGVGAAVHMHMRGRSIKMIAHLPDGRQQELFFLNNYIYSWHLGNLIGFAKPIFLPKHTVLTVECIYDNSKTNPFNPDSTQFVRWGQTFDRNEMCISHLSFFKAKDK